METISSAGEFRSERREFSDPKKSVFDLSTDDEPLLAMTYYATLNYSRGEINKSPIRSSANRGLVLPDAGWTG